MEWHKVIKELAEFALVETIEAIKKKKYGIIHKKAPVKYNGIEGNLVWDFILFNELTFEEKETGEKHSIKISASDKETEEIFNSFVEKYGI